MSEVSSTEHHSDSDRRRLDGRVRLQWTPRVVIVAVVVGVAAWFGADRTGFEPLLGVGLTAVLLVLGTVWILLQYRAWAFRVRDDSLYLERGVVRHVRTVVPYVRIQHVDTSRGPIERALGLSTLVVYTAGSRGADVSIPGLTPEEATALQGRIKELAIAAEEGEGL